jgi:hypothetical protein
MEAVVRIGWDGSGGSERLGRGAWYERTLEELLGIPFPRHPIPLTSHFFAILFQATEVRKLGRGSSGDVYLLRLRFGPQTGMLIVSKRCPIDDEMSDEQKHEMYHEVGR